MWWHGMVVPQPHINANFEDCGHLPRSNLRENEKRSHNNIMKIEKHGGHDQF